MPCMQWKWLQAQTAGSWNRDADPEQMIVASIYLFLPSADTAWFDPHSFVACVSV